MCSTRALARWSPTWPGKVTEPRRLSPMKLVTDATILDGRGSGPLSGHVIVVEGQTIQAITRDGEIPPSRDAEVIRLPGLTVLPGMIDSHVHLMGMQHMD